MASAVLYGLLKYSQGTLLPVGERAVYGALCRVPWSLAVAWVIYACFTGNGGKCLHTVAEFEVLNYWYNSL